MPKLLIIYTLFYLSCFLNCANGHGIPTAKNNPRSPNIVFIIADDCKFRDIGCYGGQAFTPNIDRLSTQGMKFSNCFQAAPMCSPTRHNIYTGLYPVKSGAYPNHTRLIGVLIHCGPAVWPYFERSSNIQPQFSRC